MSNKEGRQGKSRGESG